MMQTGVQLGKDIYPCDTKEIDWGLLMTNFAFAAGIGGALSTPVTQAAIGIVQNVIRTLGELISPSSARVLVAGTATLGASEAAAKVKPLKTLPGALSIRSAAPVVGGSVSIKIGTVELFKTPAANSMTLIEARQWYAREVQKIKMQFDNPTSPFAKMTAREKVNQALVWEGYLVEASRAALYDKNLLSAMRSDFLVKSYARYKRETPGTGQIQQEAILKKLLDREFSANNPFMKQMLAACFPAGTLVHTKEGLRPIEELKVGDWVLSKHESGEGERAYKRVTKTFVHEDREVIYLRVAHRDAEGIWTKQEIVTTSEHPFWTQGIGWREAGKLKGAELSKDELLETIGNEEYRVIYVRRLFRANQPDAGWYSSSRSPTSGGAHLNMRNFEIDASFRGPVQFESVANTGRVKPEHLYRTTVYNIEVEDFHTYFVTSIGVWVHNTKEIKVRPGVGGEPLSANLNQRGQRQYFPSTIDYAALSSNR